MTGLELASMRHRDWRRERIMNAHPALPDAILHRSDHDSKLIAKIGKHLLLAQVPNHGGCRLIARLSTVSCPAAIGRFVVAIIIDALQGQARMRLQPHVLPEVDEPISAKPTLANPDAATAIAAPAVTVGVVTTLQHALPADILGAAGKAMGGVASADSLTLQTSARLRAAAP